MTEHPIMLSRNADNRERTHWLGDDEQPACWDTHQECARHKVEQLIAARDTQAARAEQLTTAANLLANTVAMLNSMILCGESHSSTSHTVMQESLAAYRVALAAPVEAER